MKRLVTSFLSLIALSVALHAQSADRPRYQIHITRADSSMGTMLVELFDDVAPLTVRNFDSLTSIGFYDGTAFHRVIPGFMIQGGDPNSRDKSPDTWGYGDPSQRQIPAEFSELPHLRGTLSMARRGNDINSATSQFFICVAKQSQLDGDYTVFGKVLEGMNVVDSIVRAPRNASDRPLVKIEMEVRRVEVSGADGGAEGEAMAGTSVYPNPCGAEVGIRYAVREPGQVRLALYDPAGRLVAVPVDGVQGRGEHSAACDLRGMPHGVYTYRLVIDGRVSTGKFMKIEGR